MQKRMVIFLVSICIVSAVSSALAFGPKARKNQNAAKVEYEYCFCYLLTIGEQSRVSYEGSRPEVKAQNWIELAEKLGANDSDAGMRSVFNHLGSQGWRLSLIQPSEYEGGKVLQYVFERARS